MSGLHSTTTDDIWIHLVRKLKMNHALDLTRSFIKKMESFFFKFVSSLDVFTGDTLCTRVPPNHHSWGFPHPGLVRPQGLATLAGFRGINIPVPLLSDTQFISKSKWVRWNWQLGSNTFSMFIHDGEMDKGISYMELEVKIDTMFNVITFWSLKVPACSFSFFLSSEFPQLAQLQKYSPLILIQLLLTVIVIVVMCHNHSS